MTSRGRFISLEGGEGVGKSTQLAALATALRGRGIDVVETREPGGSAGAELIRELLLEKHDWPVEAEALLFAAARADHLSRTIRPALEAGKWVLCDRFIDSSLAYQGGAGGIGIEKVRDINRFATGDCLPDRTLVLTSAQGNQRARARDGHQGDRIGGRSDEFHRNVDAAFHIVAAEEPQRVRLIDASGTVEEVTSALLRSLEDLLK